MSTASRHLILGAAAGYGWPQVEIFVRSLRCTGFQGDVVLMVADTLPARDRAAMQESGLILHTLPPLLTAQYPRLRRVLHSFRLGLLHRTLGRILSLLGASVRNHLGLWELQHIGCARYAHYFNFIQRHQHRYDQVLLTDVRDVFFQANPFVPPESEQLILALESNRECLRSQTTNARWLDYAYGRSAWDAFGDSRISCAGTILGPTSAILAYLDTMSSEIARLTHRLVGQDGLDQGVHNFLLRTHRLPSARLTENGEGPFATLHGEDLSIFLRDQRGRLLNRNGALIPVVHQYDRHPELATQARQEFSPSSAGSGATVHP